MGKQTVLDLKKKARIQSWVGREEEWIWMELGRCKNDKNALYEMPIELTKIINVITLKKESWILGLFISCHGRGGAQAGVPLPEASYLISS